MNMDVRPSSDAPTNGRISVRVLLFSVLRERVGQSTLILRLAAPVTVEGVLHQLADRHDAIRDLRNVLRIALNAEYASGDEAVHDGDELALITPVSGG